MATSTVRWSPLNAALQTHVPDVGRLIAVDHGVFRIDQITYPDLTDEETAAWMADGCPDIARWRARPVRLWLTFLGGVRPATKWRQPVDHPDEYRCTSTGGTWFDVYPESGRWPRCSCCGEPMPCRAEMQDRAATEAMRELDTLTSRTTGSCWACGEPITSRQQAVAYEGDNLDLPGGPPVRFHLRRSCWSDAERYELRWIGVDPRRQRIITYPPCGGLLVVHHDGTSECLARPTAVPECLGHDTHDHGSTAACYAVTGDPCERGCTSAGHPGAWPAPRPPRRDQGHLMGVTP